MMYMSFEKEKWIKNLIKNISSKLRISLTIMKNINSYITNKINIKKIQIMYLLLD